jgi:hypothetical protein
VNDLDFGIGASGKLQAFLLFMLAVFMTAIGCGILGAPMNMHPVLGYLLKAFIGLVFGGIAAFCILHAIRAVRGRPGLPAELTARCLTCGERTPYDLVCPVCGELPHDRTIAFGSRPDEFWGQVFGATILTGVGCLGLFIMIGPFIDGERRWWALIAFFALGLLMLVVGAAGLFGFVIASWNRFKGAKDMSFSCRGPDRTTQGTGKIAWGKLIGLQGKGFVRVPLVARGHHEGSYRVSPGDMALAEAIATFDAAGLIELKDVTTYDWRVGDPSGKTRSSANEFVRVIDRQIIVALSIVAHPYIEEDEEDCEVRPVQREAPHVRDEAIWRYLARHLVQHTAMHDFKNKLDADPVHRAQFEMHARFYATAESSSPSHWSMQCSKA